MPILTTRAANVFICCGLWMIFDVDDQLINSVFICGLWMTICMYFKILSFFYFNFKLFQNFFNRLAFVHLSVQDFMCLV